jgi:hypothetical protein
LVLFSMVPGKKCLPELVSNLGSVKPKTVGFTRIEHTHTHKIVGFTRIELIHTHSSLEHLHRCSVCDPS